MLCIPISVRTELRTSTFWGIRNASPTFGNGRTVSRGVSVTWREGRLQGHPLAAACARDTEKSPSACVTPPVTSTAQCSRGRHRLSAFWGHAHKHLHAQGHGANQRRTGFSIQVQGQLRSFGSNRREKQGQAVTSAERQAPDNERGGLARWTG